VIAQSDAARAAAASYCRAVVAGSETWASPSSSVGRRSKVPGVQALIVEISTRRTAHSACSSVR
jgi:hypothetical protein